MNFNSPKRIKATFLRDIKTEALLVFTRATLEQFFDDIKHKPFKQVYYSTKDYLYVEEILKLLLQELQEYIVSPAYFKYFADNIKYNSSLKVLAKREEPLMVYYDAIIKCMGNSLEKGTPWIPELFIFTLLSEWIIEEEKSIVLFPFLNNINYLSILEIYDKTRIQSNTETRQLILKMYKVSSRIIKCLNNIHYKINTKRISKARYKK